MRKVILMILLTVVSSSAAAKWVVVAGNETITVYADPATIRKAGNRVKMWRLFDFNKAEVDAQGKSYMSSKAQVEYNCKEEQSRTLYRSFHSQNMGNGETIWLNDETDNWNPTPPESITEALWKFACKKR